MTVRVVSSCHEACVVGSLLARTTLVTYVWLVVKVSEIVSLHQDTAVCQTSRDAIDFIGRRWMAVVLIGGYLGARRFSEYRRLCAGISDRLLTQRLRELEQRGLIERTVVPTTPVQITYAPTRDGEELVRALQPLVEWWATWPSHHPDHPPQ